MGIEAFKPRPNCTTKATFAEIVAWASSVDAGEWSWIKNSPCKYVTIRLDTRAGAYALEDRDGNPIAIGDLQRQYGDTPKEPKG